MPTYDYRCAKCAHSFEDFKSIQVLLLEDF